MNIPHLRFPKFDGEWKPKRLGDVAEIYDGTHQTPTYVKNGIPFYSVEQVTANDFTNTKFVTEEVYESECKRVVIEKGDILMTRIGDIGTPRYIDWELRASFYVSLALIKQSEKYNSEFFGHYIRTKIFQKELWNRTIHVAFPIKINLGEIGNCEASFPTLPEQQKIASFFTAIDQKISQLIRKKTLFELYKKGVMQKIFSQQIRFKDDSGQEFPKWEKKKLGDVYNITSSKRVFQDEWTKSGVPFYRAREIVKLSDSGYVDNELFISNDMYNEYKSKYGVPQKNDLLVTGVGTIGILYVVKENERFYFKDGNIIWFKASGSINSQFVKQLFRTRIIRKQIEDNASITTVGTYTIESANKTVVPFPNMREQAKIANFLSAIDDKINSTQNQIDKAEVWKKGLMQQMFV